MKIVTCGICWHRYESIPEIKHSCCKCFGKVTSHKKGILKIGDSRV